MESAKHLRHIERPDNIEHKNTPHTYNAQPKISSVEHLKTIPGVRERVLAALGQRIVHEATEEAKYYSTSLNSSSFEAQKTIFPDFNTLDQAPQTD